MATAPRNSKGQFVRQETEEENEQQESLKTPTRDDLKDAILWLATNTNLVPTGWGPTAVGKTWLFREMAAEFAGNPANLYIVLASQFSADDIAGFSVIQNGLLHQQMPEWFRLARAKIEQGEKVVISFDELGLAREDVTGALYTFLRDGHLHGVSLGVRGKDYIVVAATNPAQFGAAYRTRCAFIHMPYDRGYFRSFAQGEYATWLSLHGQLESKDSDTAFSGEPPPAPAVDAGSAIDALGKIDGNFWRLSDVSRRVILDAVVTPSSAEQIWRMMQGQSGGNIAALLRFPDRMAKLVSTTAQTDIPKASALILSAYLELGNMVDSEKPEVIADAVFLGCLAPMWQNPDLMRYVFDEAEKPEAVYKQIEKLNGIAEKLVARLEDKKILYKRADGKYDGLLLVLGELRTAGSENIDPEVGRIFGLGD